MAKKEDPNEALWAIAGAVIIGIVLFTVVPKIFKGASGIIGNNSDAKKYCGKHHTVLNAKTNTAAKLAYKSCMKSY